MSNLARYLIESARRHPERPALRLGRMVITYAELDDCSSRAAALVRALGIVPGDRVALMLPNVPEFVTLYFGILKAGGVVVPLNPLLKRREVEYHLRDSAASLLFTWQGGPGEGALGADAIGARHVLVEPDHFAVGYGASEPQLDATRALDDVAVLLYTSGTTGRPKGAALTHGSLAHNAQVVADDLLHLTPDDVILGCLPLFHAFGQTCSMNTAIVGGASLSLVPRFDPKIVLDTIAADRGTIFQGVPTMYGALLHHPAAGDADVSSLRVCSSGGASLPVEILNEFERVFGCPVLEGYGSSETSALVTYHHPGRSRKPGSVGTPIRDVEVRVVDDAGKDVPDWEVGELAVRGPNVMREYWNRPDETAEAIPDGWLRTGDLGRQDEDGYFFIVDRKKDLIIRGGYNVYPREIEEVLYEHPAVAQAAVVGVYDERLGEEVGAAVVLRKGASADRDELIAYVKERVAAYKYPRHLWLTDALPLGPSGKVLKRAVIPPTPAP
ncbi:long-chain fatty acid--CoA ligase [Streptomyces hyaluromycini]|uniref:Long-chain fatty acid--CoA ligase n=1 Tax=Streptomyces hyaluromycini TaxID=1377993 RepID=A0ABV1X4K0_9ACTN